MAQYFDRFYSILKLYTMNYRASDGLTSIEMLYVFKTHKAQARHAILFFTTIIRLKYFEFVQIGIN